jgi:ABC-type transport system substrate-binding protein
MFLPQALASNNVGKSELRTVLPQFDGLKKIDPHFLVNATQSVLAANLYSSLLNTSMDNGEIVSALARRFYWNKNNLILELREDFKTPSGHVIETEDVKLSIKRMIIINRQNNRPIYSRLDELLCPNLRSAKDECKNVKIIDKRTIAFTFPSPRPEFVETLAGKPLYVLNRNSFDAETYSLKNNCDSTGYYYASCRDGESNNLIANPSHWDFSNKSPQVVSLRPEDSDTNSPSKLFLANQIDYVTDMSAISPKEYAELQKKVKDADVFRTNEIAATFLIFTNRGLSLPREVRQQISTALLQSVMKYKQNLNKYRAANNQVLIAGAFGSLTEQMLGKIESRIDKTIDYSKIPKVKLSISSDIRDGYRSKLWPDADKIFEYVDVTEAANFENQKKDDERQPHLYFVGMDLDYYESFKSVSFLLTRNIFKTRGKEAEKWLDEYMSEPEKTKREEKLRKLHYESVFEDPAIIPLFTKPYVSIARNGWKIKFAPNSSRLIFNRIVKE